MPDPATVPLRSLPRWRCHKLVDADRIEEIIHADGAVTLTLSEGAQIVVTKAWDRRHRPKVGGYFVRYDDGYESYSPAEAFDAGYTRVPPAQDQQEP